MNTDSEKEDYEVGYGKPPKDCQFKKGVSGNPSGRPKKPSDLGLELLQELNTLVTFNENGQQKVMKKSRLVTRQFVNKAASGNLPAARFVVKWGLQAQETATEQQQRSQNDLNQKTNAEDLSDEELKSMIRASVKKPVPGDIEPDK
jgi:hypothetical protein